MTPQLFITALTLGLAGSLHCVGMCGPLIAALPLGAAERRAAALQMGVYHAGRILTYALLGVLFGLAGKGLAIAGFQKALSIFAGVFMIGMAVAAWRFEYAVRVLPGFGRFNSAVQRGIARLLRRNTAGAVFSTGMLNGLLPCGMTYAALAGAVAATEGWGGGAFMAVFGLGTLPLLYVVSVLGRSFSVSVRQKWRFLQPILFVFAGALLLQRGFHLDLSLFESAVPKAGLDCH